MAVRDFDGVDDALTLTAPAYLAGSAFTLVAVLKRDTLGSWAAFLTLSGTVSGIPDVIWEFTNTNGMEYRWPNQSGASRSDSNAIYAITTWQLVAVTWPGGAVSPRFHAYDGTTWRHADVTPTLSSGGPTDWTAGATPQLRIGNWTAAVNPFDGKIAVEALWVGTAMSDAAVEGLIPGSRSIWAAQGAAHLWELSQNSTAAAVTDFIGSCDQTALVGTTVVTGSDPPTAIYAVATPPQAMSAQSDATGSGHATVHAAPSALSSQSDAHLPFRVTATATATDPLGASDVGNTAVGGGSDPGIRTIRATLLENRLYWVSQTPGLDSDQGPLLAKAPASSLSADQPIAPATLTVTFVMLRDCDLVGCRIYKTPLQAGTIPVGVWDTAGTLLSTTTVTWAADAYGGWETITFPSPVGVLEGQEYSVGYLAPDNNYANNLWVWNFQDSVSYPFWVRSLGNDAVGNRIWGSGAQSGATLTFPTARTAHNYCIDPIAQWTSDEPGYDGGTEYWDQFVEPYSNHPFMVAVFFADPPFLADYLSIGVNTIIAGNVYDPAYVEAIKAAGVDFYPGIGSNAAGGVSVVLDDPALAALVRGWHLTDEPDLASPYVSPDEWRVVRDQIRKMDSTRPIFLGLGVITLRNQGGEMQPIGAHPTVGNEHMRDFTGLVDVVAADDYCLAANRSYHPTPGELFAPATPSMFGVWAYATQIHRMRALCEDRIPVWGDVETTSEVPGRPLPDEVRKAAWAQLIAGARGLHIFDHRFPTADVSKDFAASLHDPPMRAMLIDLCAQLQTLAPALHAREAGLVSSVVSSGAMAVAKGGYGVGARVPIHYTTRMVGATKYLFAQAIRPGATTGTFTIPSAPSATLTVIGESRTVTTNGSGVFSDTFAADYAVHLYQW